MVKKVEASKATAQVVDVLAGVTPDADKLAKLIKVIANASVAQRDRVRIAAVGAIEYAIVFGNASMLTSLYEAIGSDARRNSFIKWCLHFGPVRWSEGKVVEGGAKLQGKFTMDKARTEEFTALHAKDRLALLGPMVKLPYWEFEPEPVFGGFSLPAIIAAAIKQSEKVAKDPKKSEHEKNDFNGLNALIDWANAHPVKTKVTKSGTSSNGAAARAALH